MIKGPRMSTKQWESYEEVAAYLLNQFAEQFGLGRFEGKQVVAGESGTEWQIDAKGCSDGGSHFLVVECKRHTKSGISQAITAALAWSIQDTRVRIPRDSATHSTVIRPPIPRTFGRVSRSEATQGFQLMFLSCLLSNFPFFCRALFFRSS
jgi:hypothetical protein